jgi:hypothetical protein
MSRESRKKDARMTIRLDEDVHGWIMALKDAMGVKNVSEALRRALKKGYPSIELLTLQAEEKDLERQHILAELVDSESEVDEAS